MVGGMSLDWLVQPVLTAAAAAGCTYLVSRRRFISERWWERKAEAYTRILEALLKLQGYYEEHSDHLTRLASEGPPGNLTKEREQQLWEVARAGHEEVDRMIRLGEFVISQNAHESLLAMRSYKRSVGVEPGDWFGEVDADLHATTACITQLREIAKIDLGVQSGMSWRLRRWRGKATYSN